MKIAVLNFSGNVGKTTVTRHLLAPRLPGADVIAIESLNADEHQLTALRGRQFGELQEYLQTVDHAVVDIGASNVEDLLSLMQRYRGSHEDFDCFVVPTVPAFKQQHDTVATLAELARIGIEPDRLRLLFNLVEDGSDVLQVFAPVVAFVQQSGVTDLRPEARLGFNEIFERLKGAEDDLATWAADRTDYKALIAATQDVSKRVAMAQRLATHRLARGVVPELDACFAAMELVPGSGRAAVTAA